MIVAIKRVDGVADHIAEVTRIPDGVWMNGRRFHLVPTGDIEWLDDTPAEIYVPEDQLATWRIEHPL
jgi:hypothetical protein